MWDLPGSGLEPVLPALVVGFLTTAPPGKPSTFTLKKSFLKNYLILEEDILIWDFTSSNYDCHSSGKNTNEESLHNAIE